MNATTPHKNLPACSGAILLVALLGAGALAANFSVSPAIISNDYQGLVILQIDGLTNRETVLVEKFADFNGNGVVDGDDFLMQSFQLTDGGVSMIGGATNYNVPSDRTGVDGAIRAPLNFAGIDIEHVVGRYTFRATSPGRFTNTASFTITNSAYAQSVSGVVRCGATSLANALVVFLWLENDNQCIGGTVTDGGGNYSFKLPPSLCTVVAAKSNYVCAVGNPAIVNVTSNANLVTNLTLLPATTFVSGELADLLTTNGLAGVFGVCVSADELLTVGWTGRDGAFWLPVTSNLWRLEADSLALARLGYVASEEGLLVDASHGPVTNLLALLPKATAMFYGRVTTDSGAPLAGVRFLGGDNQPDGLETEAFSDTNGNYSLGIVHGQQWWCA